MVEENGTGSHLIWALTTIIVVAIIAGAIYYSGFLNNATAPTERKVDINIETPAK